jgi:hypothetical protein
MSDYYWYRLSADHTIGELRRSLLEEYLSEAATGPSMAWPGPPKRYHYQLIPFSAVPIIGDDEDGAGYERHRIDEALRRLKTRCPEALYAHDAPLLLTHRGRWVGVSPVIPS